MGLLRRKRGAKGASLPSLGLTLSSGSPLSSYTHGKIVSISTPKWCFLWRIVSDDPASDGSDMIAGGIRPIIRFVGDHGNDGYAPSAPSKLGPKVPSRLYSNLYGKTLRVLSKPLFGDGPFVATKNLPSKADSEKSIALTEHVTRRIWNYLHFRCIAYCAVQSQRPSEPTDWREMVEPDSVHCIKCYRPEGGLVLEMGHAYNEPCEY